MATHKDYLDLPDAEFDQFFKFLNQYVAQKSGGASPVWTHIPAAARTALQDAYAAWYTAYSKTFGPHTPVDTEGKNDARKSSEHTVRAFRNQYLEFDPVTNEDRTAMGIPNKDTTRTPIGVPQTRPEFDLKVKDIRQVNVDFWDQGSGATAGGGHSKARPYGYSGAVINWLISDAAPARPEDLTGSALATHTPYTLSFSETDRGKTVYIALRWQNEKGEKGQFSEMQSTIIP